MICEPQPYAPLAFVNYSVAVMFSVDYFLHLLLCFSLPSRLCGLVPDEWDAKEKIIAAHENRPPMADPTPLSWYYQIFQYFVKPFPLVDLISILPFYISIVRPARPLLFLRILRLTRVISILNVKGSKKYTGLVQQTVKASMPILWPFALYVGVIVTLFACLIYQVENGTFMVTSNFPDGVYVRPTLEGGSSLEQSPFRSIPDALYFVVITTTTVGYGDLYPTTVMGRFFSCIFVYVGILITAFPIAIIAQNFVTEYVKLESDVEEEQVNRSAELSRLAEDDIDSDDIALETKALLKMILHDTKVMVKHADTLSVEAEKVESFSSLLKLMVTPPEDGDIEV
jgi:Ion transport protein